MVLVMPGMLVLVPNDPLTPTVQYTAYTMYYISDEHHGAQPVVRREHGISGLSPWWLEVTLEPRAPDWNQ